MGWVSDAVHHPRRLFLRRALFQVHLWAGLLLSLYLIVISLSGSVLVYKEQLVRRTLPAGLLPYVPQQTASLPQVLALFAATVPGGTVSDLQVPSPVLPAFQLTGKDGAGKPARWFGDPQTAALQPAPHTWIDTMADLHYYLLLPKGWGMQVNGVGGAVLLLLTMTGLMLWWPCVRVWTRGLRVNIRGNWRRINFDLHNALGFWTLAIVFWWALSGTYFGWYRQVAAVISVFSPVRGMAEPKPAALPPVDGRHLASLAEVLASAQHVSPGGRLWSISNATLHEPECYVLFDLRAPGDFSHSDIVRVRAADARIISVWHYGERHTLSDWILWSMHPSHFGTLWGPWFRALWALLGCSLAILTLTGVLMYWNRFLCKRWRALQAPKKAPAESRSLAPAGTRAR